MSEQVIRLPPQQYVHILDNNSNATTVLCGPVTVTLASHQSLVKKASPFLVVKPNEYAIVENPIVRDAAGAPVANAHGQTKNRLGEREVRFHQAPFPLYPNETLVSIKELVVLTSTQALVIKAVRTFTEETGAKLKRNAGDEYLFMGPGTYAPRAEEEVIETRDAIIVKFNENLQLRAKNHFFDENAGGAERQVGDEYLWSQPGAYMVGVNETLVRVVPTVILTRERALHVQVVKAFEDTREWARRKRNPGEVYLVTSDMTAEFTPHPSEQIVLEVPLVKINRKQWAVVLDPVGADGKPQLGSRLVVTNTQFFLKPGESLAPGGVRDQYVLAEDEAVLVVALEEFEDREATPPVKRVSGEQWLLCGPREYIPNKSVRVKPNADGTEKRRKLVLSEGEGVYVRNTLTGDVRAVVGQAYMLEAYEELWEKKLKPVIEEKLARQLGSHAAYMDRVGGKPGAGRDRTRVVMFHIPYNSVTQVFDYKLRTRRTIFGPDCVMLGPDEEFTVLSLSGSEWDPHRPNVCLPKETDKIKALYLFLGPASMSDVVRVETRDHARLSLQLSYDWRFDVAPGDVSQANDCFNVQDFVGDCCSAIASRVRASIASIAFEDFHKRSSEVLRVAVFGIDPATGKPRPELRFDANRLVVSSVDIQEIEVIDEKTRDALRQSVKMAIEITTQAQEAAARQEASVREQRARGLLDRQQIQDKAQSEVERKRLLEVQTQCAAIASTGQAKAEARARAEAAQIQGQLSVQTARLRAKTGVVMDAAQRDVEQQRSGEELDHVQVTTEVELALKKQMAELESGKFGRVMKAVGQATVQEIARAGPEMQARLLQGLGLQGLLVTDGNAPLNLFNTAQGLLGMPAAAAAAA